MGGKYALLHRSALGYSKCTPQHMHAELLKAFVPMEFCDFTLTIVRNPKHRLISEYKMRKDTVEQSFDEWVQSTFDRYQKNPYIYDNHIRPQWEFITETTKVFRFEDGLALPVSDVAKLVGLKPGNVPQKRKSQPYEPEKNLDIDRLIYDFYRKDYEMFEYATPQAGRERGGFITRHLIDGAAGLKRRVIRER